MKKKRKGVLVGLLLLSIVTLCVTLLQGQMGDKWKFPETAKNPELPESISSEAETTIEEIPEISQETSKDNIDSNPSLEGQEQREFLFYYEGENYFYAITLDRDEVIAFKDESGYMDVLAGGGTYQIQDYIAGNQVEAVGIENYLVSEESGETILWVVYEMLDGSMAANKYAMHDEYISVSAVFQSVDSPYQTYEAILNRTFLADYLSCQKKISEQWVYPENGDFPYKEADGIVTAYCFDDTHRLYSFVRGDNVRPLILFEDYPEQNIPVYVEDGILDTYEIQYDLVFVNEESQNQADYLALFKGRNSSFAAKVESEMQGIASSTLFEDEKVSFHINLTNLANYLNRLEVSFSLYDYEGNLHATDNQQIYLEIDEALDIPIELATMQKGIFYIDLRVESLTEEYREQYSFAMLSENEFQYADTNPFGVSGVRFGEYEPNDTTVELLQALGASNVRVCISCPDYLAEDATILDKYLKRLVNTNIRVNGQFLLMEDWVIPTKDNAQEYMAQIDETLSAVGQYLSSCEIGNEYNLNHEEATTKTAMQQYIKEYFEPGYKVIKEQYNLPFINAAVGLSDVDWMKAMVSAGIYDKQQILATHAYGFPWAPDRYTSSGFELSIEGSLKRTKKFLSQYGNKTWLVNEIGYPTAAIDEDGKSESVDLRTQADYLVRANILALSYGADEIEVYSLYDQPNVFKGLDPTNNEFHFGLFYYEDYFKRIMPKPSAVAYQNMTACLDGVQACDELETDSTTARIFRLELADGEVVYAGWSNCSRLINDKKDATKRTPLMPWENQWKESESVLIPVEGNYAEVVNNMGNKSIVPVINGYVNVTLDGSPKFIKIIN